MKFITYVEVKCVKNVQKKGTKNRWGKENKQQDKDLNSIIIIM